MTLKKSSLFEGDGKSFSHKDGLAGCVSIRTVTKVASALRFKGKTSVNGAGNSMMVMLMH